MEFDHGDHLGQSNLDREGVSKSLFGRFHIDCQPKPYLPNSLALLKSVEELAELFGQLRIDYRPRSMQALTLNRDTHNPVNFSSHFMANKTIMSQTRPTQTSSMGTTDSSVNQSNFGLTQPSKVFSVQNEYSQRRLQTQAGLTPPTVETDRYPEQNKTPSAPSEFSNQIQYVQNSGNTQNLAHTGMMDQLAQSSDDKGRIFEAMSEECEDEQPMRANRKRHLSPFYLKSEEAFGGKISDTWFNLKNLGSVNQRIGAKYVPLVPDEL